MAHRPEIRGKKNRENVGGDFAASFNNVAIKNTLEKAITQRIIKAYLRKVIMIDSLIAAPVFIIRVKRVFASKYFAINICVCAKFPTN